MRALKHIQQMRELVQRMGIYMVCFFVFIANQIVGVLSINLPRRRIALKRCTPPPTPPIYILILNLLSQQPL